MSQSKQTVPQFHTSGTTPPFKSRDAEVNTVIRVPAGFTYDRSSSAADDASGSGSGLGETQDTKVDVDDSKLRAAFATWDREGKGYIDVSAVALVLKDILGREPTDAEKQAIIGASDLNADGIVTYDEFVQSFMNKASRTHTLAPRTTGYARLNEATRSKKTHME